MDRLGHRPERGLQDTHLPSLRRADNLKLFLGEPVAIYMNVGTCGNLHE